MPDTVQLVDPSGQPHDVPLSDVAGLLADGSWHQQTSTDTSRLASEGAREQDYGGLVGGVKATALAGLRGGTAGLSDVIARGLGADPADLRGYKEQFPRLSTGAEFSGALLSTLAAPESLLSRGPVGGISKIGRTIVESAEGAGVLGKAAAATAGAAVEGGLYGGGQYLSQVALEEKPLAAEGFVGAMGKGALWAAPVGGALSLSGSAMTRAKALFPKAEVTKHAAQAIDREATTALSQAVRDGDSMLEIARQKIAQTDAAAGAAQSAENASRTMFGAADPSMALNQVEHSINKTALTEASDRYTQAKARLDDWVRAEADPDLEAALLRVRSPDIQVGAPQLRSAQFGEVVPSRVEDPALGGYDSVSGVRRDAYGTPGPHVPPQVPITQDLPPLPIADKTTLFDAKELGLTFDPKKRSYFDTGTSAGKGETISPAASTSTSAKIAIDSPIDQLSLNQLKEYQTLIDDTIDSVGPAEQQALFRKSGDASMQIRKIESGQIKDPHPYGTAAPERFAATGRSAGGSQDGSWYRDETGQQWFGKHYGGNEDRLWSEHVANQIYRKMGVSAAETEIAMVGGRPTIMSKEIVGRHPDTTSVLNQSDIHKGFVLDAWLGNRDVLGASKDNVVLVGDKAHRIDAGGATIWRAQGDQKTFVQKVSELESMRSPDRSSGRVFGKLTPEDVHQQLTDFSETYRANRADIDHLIDSSGLSREARDRIKIGLHDRAAWLETEAMGKVAPLSHEEYSTLAKGQHAQLSGSQTSDLLSYSGSPLFRAINSEIKTGKQLSELSSELRPLAENIEAAVARSEMPRDSVIYRGVNGKRSLAAVENLKPGDVYVDHGFGSTSRERRVADRLAIHGTDPAVQPTRPGVVMEISIPKGFPALAVPSNTYGKFETELLLPRGARYIVTDVSKTAGGPTVVKMAIRQADQSIGEVAAKGSSAADGSLESLLQGTKSKLDKGSALVDIGAPSRAEYVTAKAAKTEGAAAHFRSKAAGSNLDEFFGGMTQPKTRDAYVAQNIGRAMRDEGSHAQALARVEREWGEMSGAKASAKAIVDQSAGFPKGLHVNDDVIQSALRKHAGKDVNIGSDLGRAARAIGDVEEAMAGLVGALGSEAPASAAAHAKTFQAAVAAQTEAAGAGAAKAAAGLERNIKPLLAAADQTAVQPNLEALLARAANKDAKAANRAVESLGKEAAAEAPVAAGKARGLLGAAADVGTALEVLHAMGVHVPDVSAIPVIGPVLGLYLKARAVLGVLGRKGGSIGKTTESVIASKSAGVRDRVNVAAQSLLDVGAKTARRALPIAGPTGALAHQLFPGDGETKSKDIRKLYDARMDEIVRAQAPGAIEHALADRFKTSDPELQDALAAQVRRGVDFLASKAPRESMLQSMIPGDGKWHPSKAALQEWSRYVAAVHDPAGVLEDLVHGHVTVEGAETLRAVYPELYAQAQRTLLEHAAEFQKTLPYKRRVSISIMYRIPVDATMSAAHMQFLQPPPDPQAGAPAPQGMPSAGPAVTAPLQLGQQTLTSLERRAGE